MADMRRELAHIQKGFRAYQERFGEGVIWYELNADDSNFNDIFNARGIKYMKGIAVPVLWITEMEADQQADQAGQRSVGTLRFAVPFQTLREVGLSDPQDYDRHLNDVVLYERTFYRIGSYQPQGRVAREDLIVGVRAVKTFPEEDMVYDEIPEPELDDFNETVRPHGDFVDYYQQWENYEPPAGQVP